MIVLIENSEVTAAGSLVAETSPAVGQYSAEPSMIDVLRSPIMSGIDLQRLERDGSGDVNELGLSPAYSSYVNRKDIEDFLLRKPHVVEILNDLAPYLEKKYAVTEICLKHTSNDYYEFDALRVTPRFHTKDVGELIKLHKRISYEFFGRLDKSLTENITFAF